MRSGGGPRVLLSGNKQGFYHISSSDSETAFRGSLSLFLRDGERTQFSTAVQRRSSRAQARL
ncbi:hypothetical protein ABG768_012362, partial [Culter alburnus]